MMGPTPYPVTPTSRPGDITGGPDGRLWFTEWDAGKVGAVTTAGLVGEYTLPGRLGTPESPGPRTALCGSALRHKRRARVVVSVTASDSAGQTTTATVKVKLKLKR
jgi:virginiamycin B lyase